jgi:hypothetical protein
MDGRHSLPLFMGLDGFVSTPFKKFSKKEFANHRQNSSCYLASSGLHS